MTESAPDYAILDRLGIGAGIFFPRPDATPTPPGSSDHRIAVADGAELHARLYRGETHWPTILYFHGNGEVVADHDGIAPIYHQAGLNLFVVDFRGYGRSTGTPTFSSLTADAESVLERFHEILDSDGYAEPRFVMGRSLGAHPALEIASHNYERLRGLIIESGAGSLGRLATMAGGDTAVSQLVEAHEAKLRAIALPALIIHGEVDQLIPLANAVRLHDTISSNDKQLLVIPGAGHNDILWVGMKDYFGAIKEFAGRLAG